ncbi:hypothetical protein [Streptomyces rishiriensis]|uniref:hypothetical protein n=1 Tax=Streptomyces rishiriensis TaxID=68264 RepID=UPI0027D91217|nr:hypothetical protein [Streptomyces rishiriensis]
MLRVCVDDLEASVSFYERLAGTGALRFERGRVQVAAVGCFLPMSGPAAELDLIARHPDGAVCGYVDRRGS